MCDVRPRCRLSAGGSHARQRIELLLPINQRRNEFTDPEASDYPESQDVVYKTAMETAAAVIRAIDPDGGELTARRVDDDNDPVGTLRNAAGTVRAVVIPNAQNLGVLREMANLQDADGGLTLLFNPQWNEAGQVVSDFGIGPWKRRAMDFLNTFELSYSLGARSAGGDPRPGEGRLHGRGRRRAGAQDARRGVAGVRHGRRRKQRVRARRDESTRLRVSQVGFRHAGYSLRTRRWGAGPSLEARLESAATARSENGGAAASGGADGFDWSIASVAEISAAVRAKALTSEDCDALGKSGLRSALPRSDCRPAGNSRRCARDCASAPGRRQRRVGLNRTRRAPRVVSFQRRGARVAVRMVVYSQTAARLSSASPSTRLPSPRPESVFREDSRPRGASL